MARPVLALLLGALALALVYGAAASLGVGSDSLGAGGAAVQRCDTSFTRTINLGSGANAGKVVSVTIGDVADTCNGGQMSVALTDGANNKLSEGSAAVAGSSVTVPVTPVPVSSVRNVYVVVVGP